MRRKMNESRPAWGAWIEIYIACVWVPLSHSRAPHGARGLKFDAFEDLEKRQRGRAPHGARGLKFFAPHIARYCENGRAPHGARGLKSEPPVQLGDKDESRPAWGAWIEIPGLAQKTEGTH